jgi:integrase
MFNLAKDWGYVKENPVEKIKFFSEKDNQKERILTNEEERKLLGCCSPTLGPIVLTALHTGMRKGEILALRYDQIDFVNSTVRVGQTKSGKPRVIPANDTLMAVLLGLKSRKGASPFVFANPQTGRPFHDLKRQFSRAIQHAGITGLRFHDLRHTFASRLVALGVDLITVKELLGHHSVRMTERYTHSSLTQKRSAVEKLTSPTAEFIVPKLSTKRQDIHRNALLTVN